MNRADEVRLTVEALFDGDATRAVREIGHVCGVAVAYQDRTTLESTLGRPFTDDEWAAVKLDLDEYDEWLDNSGAAESISEWLAQQVEAIPHDCTTCGEPMFVTSAGVGHHVVEDGMGEVVEGLTVDHDADADHTPYDYDADRVAAERLAEGGAKLFARVTNQGTAMPEATLCGLDLTTTDRDPSYREECDQAADAAEDVGQDHTWHDVSGNEALECVACGKRP